MYSLPRLDSFKIIGACGLPRPEAIKDIAKLIPHVKVEVRTEKVVKKETKRKRHTGANVVWNETLAFNRVVDDLGFVR
jgi:hypothetical protein